MKILNKIEEIIIDFLFLWPIFLLTAFIISRLIIYGLN